MPPKIEIKRGEIWRSWRPLYRTTADQSKHPETADPKTDALEYHNEVELHLAGSKLGSHLPRLAGKGEFLLATY